MVFYYFFPKSLFTENYFPIAAINLATRGPLYTCLVLAQIIANGSFYLRKRLNLLIDVLTRKYRHMPSRLAYRRVLDDPFPKFGGPKIRIFGGNSEGFATYIRL